MVRGEIREFVNCMMFHFLVQSVQSMRLALWDIANCVLQQIVNIKCHTFLQVGDPSTNLDRNPARAMIRAVDLRHVSAYEIGMKDVANFGRLGSLRA